MKTLWKKRNNGVKYYAILIIFIACKKKKPQTKICDLIL